MKKYYLDYNERQIVHAAIRMTSRRGKTSPFTKQAERAISKARADLDIGEAVPEVRAVIINKIVDSIAYNQPWEQMGETYCYRGQFYQHRKQFCYLVAENMGLIATGRKSRKESG